MFPRHGTGINIARDPKSENHEWVTSIQNCETYRWVKLTKLQFQASNRDYSKVMKSGSRLTMILYPGTELKLIVVTRYQRIEYIWSLTLSHSSIHNHGKSGKSKTPYLWRYVLSTLPVPRPESIFLDNIMTITEEIVRINLPCSLCHSNFSFASFNRNSLFLWCRMLLYLGCSLFPEQCCAGTTRWRMTW